MNFDLSGEQLYLQQTLTRYLQKHYTFSARQAVIASAAGWAPEFWKALAHDLGLFGLTIPESFAGQGGGAIENMIVMETFGRALVIEPYLPSIIIGAGFLKYGGGTRAREILTGLIAGEVVIAFAHAEVQCGYGYADVLTTAQRTQGGWILNGKKTLVVAAPWATHLIVVARTAGAQRSKQGISLFLIESDSHGVQRRDYSTADGQAASQITFDQVRVPESGLIGAEHQALLLIERVMDEATAALCAEAVGCMRELLERTLSYCLQRRQFGLPLAQFQVLQHRIADMHIALEQAVSAVLLATLKLDKCDGERARAVSTAKVIVGKALRFVGQSAVQLHGGMGLTEELALGHYFRRATMIENLFGSADHHIERYCQQQS